MRRILVWLSLLVLTARVDAQPPVRYVHDGLGRLLAVIDPSADTAVYGYDEVGNLLSIRRYASSTVSVITFSPGAGPVGTTVTIAGTGFSATPSQNTVTFGGRAGVVASSSGTEVVVTVPAGATSGPISVTTPSGSATSATPFTVSDGGVPTITGINPRIGGDGTRVTITGTNFASDPARNATAFNTRWARVDTAAATSLSTSVPIAAGSGHITVATDRGTATSGDDFFVPPAPYVATDVVATGRLGPPPASLTLAIDTPGKIGLAVFDGAVGERVTLNARQATMTAATLSVYGLDQTLMGSTSVTPSGGGLNLIIPAAGTYTVLVDPTGQSMGSLTLDTATPDLAPTALTAPASVSTQQVVPVSWTVKNQGTGAASRFTDTLYLSSSPVCCAGATSLAGWVAPTLPLASGASYSQSKSVTIPNVAAGSYYLHVWTDSWAGSGEVYESSETNNTRAVPVVVGVPDLTPTALTTPTSVSTQQTVSVSWTVRNQGTGAAQRFTDYLYLSPSSVCCAGATSLGGWLAPTLPLVSGASYTQTRTVTIPNVAAGAYYFHVWTDLWGGVGEVYEVSDGNNVRTAPVTVGVPDLTPTALTAPTSLPRQQLVNVTWTVKNQGSGVAQRFTDYLYLSPSSVCCTGATNLGGWLAPTLPLAAGVSYTQTKSVTIPNVPPGSYYLHVWTDFWGGAGEVYESNDTNNTRALAVIVQ